MNLLFDLDGTLTDPFEGITKSILHALNRLDRPLPSAEALRWCIGPPLKQSFTELLSCDDGKLSEKALSFYRERFETTGLYENQLYRDIPQVLTTLKELGHKLFVATSKPTVYAAKIITHFELSVYFKSVYGSELDGTLTDKSSLISHILQEESIHPSQAIMIGDRKHDVHGAKENDLYCLGVLWGYGDREELEAAGANALIKEPLELIPAVKLAKNPL